MKGTTERLLQIAATCAILYFGWNFLSASVVYLINLQMQVGQLTKQVQACQAAVSK